MPHNRVKTRFAPSPTGALHLGNVRTALLNWLLARREGGCFLLRIEDTDRTRSTAESEAALLADLRWLGLQWDEGPEAGGDDGPYRQSERAALYDRQFAALEQQDLVYPCFCTPEELEAARRRALAAGRPPRYPGTCASLNAGERKARLADGRRPTLRFRVRSGGTVKFNDLVRGHQRFTTDDIGDFIVRRADGSAAFFFCNALDDALMGVTHVLRGEDHLSNTPRQLLLLQALGLEPPRYGHIAIVVGEDGAPLSKRHGSLGVAELRGRGYLPLAVNNTLARLGHTYAETHLMDAQALASGFDVERLGKAAARFDTGQLDHWQREAVGRATVGEFMAWLPVDARALVPEPVAADFVETVRGNVLFPEQAAEWARITFEDPLRLQAEAEAALGEAAPGYFDRALEVQDSAPGGYDAFVAALKEKTGLRGKGLFKPLRAALTGRLDGPELAKLYGLLGPERVRRRLAEHASG